MTQGIRPDGQIFASAAGDGELEDFPAETRGWGVTIDGKDADGKSVTDPTNGIPPMEWMNWILNKLSNQIFWNMRHAIPAWAAGTWDAGAFVTYSGWIYYNAAPEAVDAAPEMDEAWVKIMPISGTDDRYLVTKNNLSEIKKAGAGDQQAARGNLGLGSAAVANVQTETDGGVNDVVLLSGYTHFSKSIKLDRGTGNSADAVDIYVSANTDPETGNERYAINFDEHIDTLGGKEVREAGTRVYSPNNPPPAQDLSGFIRGDACSQAGFVSQNAEDPYMMYGPDTIVELAPRSWVNVNFVTATGLGAQFAATRNGDEAFADAGCTISGIGDFGADDGYGYQRPSQYCINGQWYTANALGETLQSKRMSTAQATDYPDTITHLTNLKLYTPEDPDSDLKKNTLYLISDEGYDFYAASEFLAPGMAVGYDPESGVIRLIAPVSPHIWPINMSVVIVDELPDGCSMDGTWVYSDGTIKQDADLLLGRNKRQLIKRLSKVSGLILMYQLTGGDENLSELTEYVIAMRGVDLTQSHPDWPVVPAELS